MKRRTKLAATIVLSLALMASLAAQRQRFMFWDETSRNVPYDGRFTFVRLRYTPAPGGYWAGPSWVHGYPVAEESLLRIMKEITFLDMHVDDASVLTLDQQCGVQPAVEKALSSYHVRTSSLQLLGHFAAVFGMVALGLGIGVVPSRAQAGGLNPAAVMRPLRPQVTSTVMLVRRKSRSLKPNAAAMNTTAPIGPERKCTRHWLPSPPVLHEIGVSILPIEGAAAVTG